MLDEQTPDDVAWLQTFGAQTRRRMEVLTQPDQPKGWEAEVSGGGAALPSHTHIVGGFGASGVSYNNILSRPLTTSQQFNVQRQQHFEDMMKYQNAQYMRGLANAANPLVVKDPAPAPTNIEPGNPSSAWEWFKKTMGL